MNLFTGVGTDRELVVSRDRQLDPETMHRRILEISTWVLILGSIRFLGACWVLILDLLELLSREPFSFALLSRLIRENPPALLLGAFWPLLLGLILRRTGWPDLLRSVTVTFSILSLVGVVTLFAGISLRMEPWLHFGSFTVLQGSALQLRPTAIALATLGVLQLLMEFGTGMMAWLIDLQSRSNLADPPATTPRRRMLSRIAIYVSVALLFLSIRSPLWSAYVDLLSRSDTLRQFVLQNDLRSRGSRPRRSPAEVQASSQLAINELIETAKQATASNQWNVAAEGYRRAIAACEVRLRAGGGAGNLARNDLALALNNLAWLLCTCPDPKILDGDGAVALARRAVEVVRDEGIYWNTLGAAYYRAQKYEEAKSALFRSMELRDEGDSFDWFFLGMTYARLGRLDKGRDWYVRASEWFRARKSQDPELYRFQVETAERLGLPRPSPPPPLPVVVQQPRPLDFMPRGMRGPRRNQGPRIFPGIPGLESNNR